MRKIKFRAWDKSQKYMAYQGMPDLETLQSFIFHFGDKELMQFVGLKDCKGREIYEGDIVQYKSITNFGDDVSHCKNTVKYKDGSFYPLPIEEHCEDEWYSEQKEDYEIIGNIYENPNILEREE